MKSLKGQAFVLKTLSYSDADLIVYILSKTDGLLHLFVRGAKRSKKRFSGGVLEPPHLIEFETQPLKNQNRDERSLISLKEAALLQDFSYIRESYSNLECLFSMIQVMLLSEAGQEDLFNHFGGALKALKEASNLKRFFTHFVIRYLCIEGVLPQSLDFDLYVSTPLSSHASLKEISSSLVDREAAMASHLLKSYASSKKEIRWPK